MGNTAWHIAFIENLGGNPVKWAAPELLEADGEVIRIMAGPNGSIQGPAEAKWGYTTLTIADWNHNSLPDLIVNSIWGKVIWYENIGTSTEPKLAAAKPVEVLWDGEVPKPSWNWWNPEGNAPVTGFLNCLLVLKMGSCITVAIHFPVQVSRDLNWI